MKQPISSDPYRDFFEDIILTFDMNQERDDIAIEKDSINREFSLLFKISNRMIKYRVGKRLA